MKGLSNKVAIITGSATSIGAEVARAFVEAGTRVIIADIAEEAGAALASDLGEAARFVRTNVMNDADLKAAVETAVETWGQLDFVVNTACTYLDNGMDSTREEFLEALNINAAGGFMLVQYARPHLKASKGAVVNFGSISAKVAQPGRCLYPMSKGAIHQLTRNEALLLAEDGIRVNTVSPGWTWCTIMDQVTDGNRAKTDQVAAPFHMTGRVGDQREVADAVLFLCSDHASFITGTDLPVDGGYTALGPEQQTDALSKLAE
ncbi:SDR family oxidoreductase [Paremcibacter congregatus]|uniref:SDR family oxidoreductase n=1 Tax=Paremcibacter congregatus TaxID=2043170 RepID=UPI003A94EFBB|tara:strand:+ start:7280 stop:8065 length:786 start_codon:yes stop_codon:yes gene_type:complete